MVFKINIQAKMAVNRLSRVMASRVILKALVRKMLARFISKLLVGFRALIWGVRLIVVGIWLPFWLLE